ncbi:uncharacterized protein [Euwallacea fornicatus]|uniref:uncharacterized protein isoform X1 n=1 Tax=Euwallacea fornicatus TaxID=995702 RepID=UPI00338F35CB
MDKMCRSLVVWIAAFVHLLVAVQCVNVTYILRIDGTHLQPSCIAEGLERYQALGWVYPVIAAGNAPPNATVKYIPSIDNDYNCKFSKNDKCNVKWAGRDWQIDETSSRTREFIDDNRWEDFPTVLISNATADFQNRFYLESSNKVGFSIRALGYIELFLCTGWNPANYPCYYFHIDKQEMYFTKIAMLTPQIKYKESQLEYSQVATNVISFDEWRSFEIAVSDSGSVTLMDKSNPDRTLINHTDAEPLKPSYLLMRSQDPSFWKVAENFFMYTETPQISRMGPQIQTTYKDLCISMFVATCSHCQMTFFYVNGSTQQELKYVGPTNDKWIEVKLKQENIKLSKFNLFVKTEFLNKPEGTEKGFWAYDSVRVCNENEVKVTYLQLNQTFEKDDSSVDQISCQLIRKPSFRPRSFQYDKIEDHLFSDLPLKEKTANDTSITLKWVEEDLDHYLTYFVFYQGNDLCATDIGTSPRLKSGGFLTTKHNEITITKLVPYTQYNITISSVLHEKDKIVTIYTLETDEPTLEELPIQIHIQPLERAVNISWAEPACNAQSGRLIYNIIVYNEQLGFQKVLELQDKNFYYITGLRAYTKHNLTITTARNGRNLRKGVHTKNLTYEFSTLPGAAPAVRNLELYAIGPNNAYLRYDLPSNPGGIPVEVEVTRCNVLSRAKCKSAFSSIARCELWPKKMCVEVDYLMPDQNYTFKVSVKNANTNISGKDTEIKGESVERVPAPPENVTYQVVDCQENIDYCHLNISWVHPYYPNATISAFNIILNSTYFNSTYSEEDQTIHEVYRIVNNTYFPRYSYQVKYVPYSHEYTLYLQSWNSKYKSNFATTTVKTADLGDHIDQSPKLLGNGDKGIVFKLPHVDRRLESYNVTIAVQDLNQSMPVNVDSIKNRKLADNLCVPFGVTWVSQILKVHPNETKIITVTGLDEKRTIQPKTTYCIIFIITNKYHGEEHDVVYYERLTTPDGPEPPEHDYKSSSFSHLYWLALLLLLVPISFFLILCIKRRANRNRARCQNMENVYESLPFEEQNRNYANNRTYDQLIHK